MKLRWLLSCLPLLRSVSTDAAEWRLDLEGAFTPQHAAQVYLREKDGAVVESFALAPTFNKTCGRVEASKLRRQDGSWQGGMTITLPSDGWNPPQGSNLVIVVERLASTGGSLRWEGLRNGKATCGTGSVQALPSNPSTDPVLLSLTAIQGNPLAPGEHSPRSRPKNLQIRMALCGDRAETVILREQASPVDTGNDIVVTRSDIRGHDGEWRGGIEAEVRHQADRRSDPWRWLLECVVIGDRAAGTLSVVSKESGGSKPLAVAGSILPVSSVPGQALMMPLVLNGALPEGGNLECYLEFDGGHAVSAFATGPNANNATHVVDARGLEWAEGRIRGDVGVVLQADPWNPPDHLPVPMTVGIDAAVVASGAAVQGRFRGCRGSQVIQGRVEGLLQPVSSNAPATRATIKFEDGLLGAGDKAWFRRAFVGLTLDSEGRVTGGKVSNNHSRLAGSADSGWLKCGSGRLEGEISLTVRDGNITPGRYRFRFKGPLVGGMATGLFELLGEGNEVLKTGSFWAAIQP